MKKILAFALAAMMAVMAGCGSAPASSVPSSESSVASEQVTEAKPVVIGIVQPMDHPSLNQIRESIVEELDALGLTGSVKIEYRNANGDPSMLPTIMNELIGGGVDILVPIATGTAQAAAAATDTLPIIFSAVSNPVEAGLVTSFEETTGNITGVSNAIAIEEIFALAKELTPKVKTFGFVYTTSEVNSMTGIKRARAYCDANGISYKEAAITGVGELQSAAQSLVGKVDAFFTPNDNTIASAISIYMQVANDAGIPVYVGADSMVADGGLATVGIDYTVLGRQTAQMIARILGGETIAQNHVEQVKEYAKMINMATANQLSITVPEALKKEFVIIKE
ncbi:MAG: ABC transporter substrate-binding protein [Candidatus Fimivivens sp.]|nr:ABC transporter substrate-binding protein [Candidatus Fimivivens sp.]